MLFYETKDYRDRILKQHPPDFFSMGGKTVLQDLRERRKPGDRRKAKRRGSAERRKP